MNTGWAKLSFAPSTTSPLPLEMGVVYFLRKLAPWSYSAVSSVSCFGWLIGQALTWGTTIYLHRQNLPGVKISHVPWWLARGAIGFAIIVSLIAGLYPGARAARLNPVKPLRYK